MGNLPKKKRQPPISPRDSNRCVELRRKTAELKKAILKKKRMMDSQEYIEKNCLTHPGKPIPPEMYDKSIMPKTTKY